MPAPIAVALIVVALGLGLFLLLMGIANLVNPDVPEAYYTQNTIVTLLVTIVGFGCLGGAAAMARGAFRGRRERP